MKHMRFNAWHRFIFLAGLMATSLTVLAQTPSVSIGSATLDPLAQSSLNIRVNNLTIGAGGFPIRITDMNIASGQILYPTGSFNATVVSTWNGDIDGNGSGDTSVACQVLRDGANQETGRINFSVGFRNAPPLRAHDLCSIAFTAKAYQPTAAAQALDVSASCADEVGPLKSFDKGSSSVPCNGNDGALTVRQAAVSSDPGFFSTVTVTARSSIPARRPIHFVNSGTFRATLYADPDYIGYGSGITLSTYNLDVPAGGQGDMVVQCPRMTATAATPLTTVSAEAFLTIYFDPVTPLSTYPLVCERRLPALAMRPGAITQLADADSRAPALNADGRLVVFQSRATNMVAVGSGADEDIFVFDTATGNFSQASVDNAGNQIASDTVEPTVSAQGDLVAFVANDADVVAVLGESKAEQLKRRKGNGAGVYLRNLLRNTTQRVGGALPTRIGTRPQLAPSGDALVYVAPATDDVGVPGQDVFLVKLPRSGDQGDRSMGDPECVSCSVGGKTTAGSDEDNAHVVVSADGNFVAWESKSVLPGQPCAANGATQILLRNMITGATQSMSRPPTGVACPGAGQGSRKPSMDYSGRKVVFESDVALESGTPGDDQTHVFLVDLDTGLTTRLTETVSSDTQGTAGNGDSTAPVISGDGSTVAFVSEADNLDQAGTAASEVEQVYVAELNGRRITRMRRASRTDDNALGDSGSQAVALDYSGRRLSFDSNAYNLSPQAPNDSYDVFAQDNPLNPDKLFRAGFE